MYSDYTIRGRNIFITNGDLSNSYYLQIGLNESIPIYYTGNYTVHNKGLPDQ